MVRLCVSLLLLLPCVVLLLSLQLVTVNSYKILMAAPSHSKSHLIIGSALMKGLAEAGHEVTMISSFPQKEKIPNYRDIYLPVPESLTDLFGATVTSGSRATMLTNIYQLAVEVFNYADSVFDLPEVQKLMKEESFDLVIGGTIGSRLMSGLSAHFECPMAMYMPIKTMIAFSYPMGNDFQFSTSPSLMSGLRNPMSFFERVVNVVVTGLENLMFSVWDSFEASHYNKRFPSPKYPNYWEISRNVSLILSAHHFSQGVVANVPAIVEIGGIQMDSKLALLPDNLEQFLNNATEGVIFFSFGTNVAIKKQDQVQIKAIISALGRMKMKVLFKYDSDEKIPDLPKNILTASWLPQKEILAHPNVRLFVSHGGLGSIMESKYYGVPVLGIPIFGDQPGNVQMAVDEGWAVELHYLTLTEESMFDALNLVLGDPRYTETVKQFSDVYRDRPLGPMKTAVFWIEYVIRHKGAAHMQSAAIHQNILQRNSLDVLAFLSGCLVLLGLILKYIFRAFLFAVKFVLRRNVTVKDKSA